MFSRELKAYALRPTRESDHWVGEHLFPEGEPPSTSKPFCSARYIDENGKQFFVSYTEEQVKLNRDRNMGVFCPYTPLLISGPMPPTLTTAQPKPILTFRDKPTLSSCITIHVSSSSLRECIKHGCIQCPTSFTLSKWVTWSMNGAEVRIWNRAIDTQLIEVPIDACWVERFERRSVTDCNRMESLCLITAGDLQGLQLWPDECDNDVKEYAMAIGVFMRALPKNWPIVIYCV